MIEILEKVCENCGNPLGKRQKRYCGYSCIFQGINKKKEEDSWHPTITPELHDIIEGSLMGDGSLELQKTCNNPRFVVTQMDNKKEYLQFLSKKFDLDDRNVTSRHKYHRKSDKYFDSWVFATRTASEFLPYYKRWYPEGKKIIPKDFKITPTSLLHWYIGDGSFYQSDKERKVTLYTNGFTLEDVVFVQSELKKLNINFNLNLTKYKNYPNKYPILKTGKKYNIFNFFNFIDKNPISCYEYKFNVKF